MNWLRTNLNGLQPAQVGYAALLTFTAFVPSAIIYSHLERVLFLLPLAAVVFASLRIGFQCALMITFMSSIAWPLYFGVGFDSPSRSFFLSPLENDLFVLPMFIVVSTGISLVARQARIEREYAVSQHKRFVDLASHLDHTIVWEVDAASLDFLFVGENLKQILGYTPEEWRKAGKEIWKTLMPPEDIDSLRDALRRSCSDSPAPERFEHRMLAKDGSIHWFQTGILLRHHLIPKETYSVYGVSKEITSLVEAQQSLEEARQAADTANETKSQFLANMSHEIRTPMGIIQGFAELLAEGKAPSEEQKHWARTIERNAESLTAILNDILDLSRIEAGKLNIESLRFPFPELVEDLASFLRLKAEAKDLRINVSGLDEVPRYVTSDPIRIRQVLMNLVNNAIKFTSQGEISVLIAFKAADSPYNKGVIEISVSDTGIGLTAEQQSRIFQAFGQGDASTKRKYGGSGLGLVISRQLAQALGGDLELKKTAPNRGSTFVFTFDCGCPEVSDVPYQDRQKYLNQAKARRADVPDLSGIKVLLVEDSKDNQLLLSRVLTGAGASVEIASNGHEGVKSALEKFFDLVLMDIQMPVLDGNEATLLLRRSGYERPIVALTAHALKEERDRSMLAGFSAYVTKPVDKDSLIRAVYEHGVLSRETSGMSPYE
jgi:PAS domain S-box-containing protein